MHTVVLGAGRVGYQLAKQLIEENRDVAVIERDPRRAREVSDLLDCLVVAENEDRRAALKQAGIQDADFFVAATDSDDVNLITCGLVAGEFRVKRKIARVRSLDFVPGNSTQQSFLGIDHIVNPEREVTRAITTAIDRGAVSDIMLFEESPMQVRSITVDAESVLAGREVQELRGIVQSDFLVIAVVRNSEYLVPTGTTRILENDKLYLLATETDFDSIFHQMGKTKLKLDRIVVIGGLTMGRHVVEYLLPENTRSATPLRRLLGRLKTVMATRKITVIEQDYEACKRVSELFSNVLVVNSDISDERFDEEEHLTGADLVVATTDNQELNIINAVYAKKLGTKRSVALVNRSQYVHVATSLGVDVAISPVDSMVSTILKDIRTGNVRRVHNISGSNIDIIELSVGTATSAVGRRIADLKLPPESLIIAVTREKRNIIPDGNLVIQNDDHLIVIARKEHMPRIEEILTR